MPSVLNASRAAEPLGLLLAMIVTVPVAAQEPGAAPPAGIELDGVDQSAVFTKGAASPRQEVILFNNEDVIGLRTPRWKLVTQSYYRTILIDTDRWGAELFDMNEGAETYSLAATYPDETKAMQARLAAAKARFAPFRRGVPPAVEWRAAVAGTRRVRGARRLVQPVPGTAGARCRGRHRP